MIEVLLADDHAVVRDGLKVLLQAQPDIRVVALAADGRQALEQAQEQCPDVAVMDIGMPQLNGIDAALKVREHCPQTKIVILSIHATIEYVACALQAGALGYLLKESAGNDSVRRALRAWLEVSFPNYHFLEAATPEEALVLAVDLAPQAAVLPLGRAVHSNVKLIRALKAALPRLHVIAVSGHEPPEYRAEVRDAGASAFLATPDLGTGLIPTVGRFLDQAETR